MIVLSLIVSLSLSTSKVSSVVVYPDRAQVTREAMVACSPHATALFEGLPPAMDPATVRARAEPGEIAGLRTEARTRAAAFAQNRHALEEKIHQIELEVATTQEAIERANARERQASRLDDVAVNLINRELAAPKPNVKGWSDAFDRALSERVASNQSRVALSAKLREQTLRLSDGRAERDRLSSAAARREYVAEVVVSCPAGRQARVELTYRVGGASWVPVYEARADEGNAQVELSTFATVEQSTGEDWTGAHLALSTAIPLENATPPEIHPLKVFSEKHEAEQKVLVRRDEEQQHAETGGLVAANPSGSSMAASSQGLSVQLAVPGAVDVPADGKPVRLFVARSSIKAKFALRTVPKLMPLVFKVADLANTGSFPLLAGDLDAYGKSGFIARYPLERVPKGGTFHLTFGVDDRIRVRRDVLEEVVRDQGLFGQNRRYRYGYRYTVANYASGPQRVELAEHVPVSELEDVKVELDPKTTGGYALDATDGIATWKLDLSTSEQKTIELAFHVDVPSSYQQ